MDDKPGIKWIDIRLTATNMISKHVTHLGPSLLPFITIIAML